VGECVREYVRCAQAKHAPGSAQVRGEGYDEEVSCRLGPCNGPHIKGRIAPAAQPRSYVKLITLALPCWTTSNRPGARGARLRQNVPDLAPRASLEL